MSAGNKQEVKSPLISVIVPIFNVEKYLPKCLDSITGQDYRNLEIILVNDGSTDNSLSICKVYAQKDSRIKLINQKNTGLSGARNRGIDIAKGEFLAFVDSDDYVELDYISTLYTLISQDQSDISAVKHDVIYPKRTEKAHTGMTFYLFSHQALKLMLYGNDFDVSAWGKLYRKSLFKDVRFPIGMLFEDSATTYKLILNASTISFSSIPLYHYVIRNNSITNCQFSTRDFDLIDATKQMCADIIITYPDLQSACNRRIMYAYLSTLSKLALSTESNNTKYLNRLLPYITSHRKTILKDKAVPKRDRYALKILGLGYKPFRFIWRQYNFYRKSGIM